MRGFTLLEVLVVAAIFLIVGTLLGSILISNTGLYNKQTSLVSSGLNVNDVVREIEIYIKPASSIAPGYPEQTPSYITGTETLVLKLPSYNALGVINNTYDFVVIAKNQQKNNVMELFIFPDSQSERNVLTKTLTTILQSIEFKYLDKNGNIVPPASAVKVQTNITIQPTSTGLPDQTRSAVIVTNLRNL